MNRASGSTCSRSPGRQKKRQSSSKPSGAPSSCRDHLRQAREREEVRERAVGLLDREPQHLAAQAPRARSAPAGGACSSLNPVAVRSPASAGRRKSTVSETFASGRSNGIPFQPSTIRSEEAPIPSAKRPPLASASAAACWASSAGPRVKHADDAGAEAHRVGPAAASASGVKPSGPLVSPLQRSV